MWGGIGFKFNNLGLELGTNLKFYISVVKGLKVKVRKIWGLIHTFVEPPSLIGLITYLMICQKNAKLFADDTIALLPKLQQNLPQVIT